jgi:hypothetical protein
MTAFCMWFSPLRHALQSLALQRPCATDARGRSLGISTWCLRFTIAPNNQVNSFIKVAALQAGQMLSPAKEDFDPTKVDLPDVKKL